MYCKCKGRFFLDRVFTDNTFFEIYCILCGDRKFISKDSDLGKWLEVKEKTRNLSHSLAG